MCDEKMIALDDAAGSRKISDQFFNEKRRNLLMMYDRSPESVMSEELAMYDLTTYCKPNKHLAAGGEDLASQILEYKKELRRIKHLEGNFFFMPEQEDAIKFIEDNKKSIILAPTSFGKTLIVKEYIYRHLPKRVAYIVPTNALAFELVKAFKQNPKFQKYSVFDKETAFNSKPDEMILFLGTQEKYVELAPFFGEVDLFVIDEAYKLQEDQTKKQRAYKLSKAFLKSASDHSKKAVLLTPIAKLQGFDNFGFKQFETHFNAVDRTIEQVDPNAFYDKLFEKVSRDKEKTILYFDSPNGIADEFVDNRRAVSGIIPQDFIDSLEADFHPEWSVVKLLKKGILTHHGQMPRYVQNHMMRLFLDGNTFNLLVGTNSISEGINTPTKNLFFSKTCRFNKKDRILYKNTIGRAGRLGEYPIGHIYTTDKEKVLEIDRSIVNVVLDVSDMDKQKELLLDDNPDAVNETLVGGGITDERCIEELKKLNLSRRILKKILSALKEDRGNNINETPLIAGEVFEDYKRRCNDDKVYYCGYMKEDFDDQGTYRRIETYEDRIAFFRHYNRKSERKLAYSKSTIIEGYVRFIFSSLEFNILPVMKAGRIISEYQKDFAFGANVKYFIDYFFENYNKKIYGPAYSKLSDKQKHILDALREYGVPVREFTSSENVVVEIEKQLNVRYSTYDVINAMRALSARRDDVGRKCWDILKRYFLTKD